VAFIVDVLSGAEKVDVFPDDFPDPLHTFTPAPEKPVPAD
jgi:hypothetical protein